MKRENMKLRFKRAYEEAMFEIRHPKQIEKEVLFKKVRQAAKSTGIEDVVIHEWNPNLLQSWFTDGALGEKKYSDKNPRYNSNIDIGYFVKENDKYNVRSFHINGFVFSDDRYKKFYAELSKRGLESHAHMEFGLIFPTEAEIKRWDNRKPLYK